MHSIIYIIFIMYPLYLTFLKGINSFIIYKIFHKDIHILSPGKYFSFFKIILACNQNVETDYL